MAPLSFYTQAMQTWIANGGNPAAAPTAAAIASAESGQGTNLVNPNDPGGSYGWWQINGAAHPQYNTGLLTSDPNYNAQAAIAVSNNGTNWTPWTTYQTGAYKAYLPGGSATTAGDTLPPNEIRNPDVCATGSILGWCPMTTRTLRHVKGGALMIGGGALILFAMAKMAGISTPRFPLVPIPV